MPRSRSQSVTLWRRWRLFTAQIVFGLTLGLQYLLGDFLFLHPVQPGADGAHQPADRVVVVRLHGLGLLPGAESETELYSPKLALALFWIFLAAGC